MQCLETGPCLIPVGKRLRVAALTASQFASFREHLCDEQVVHDRPADFERLAAIEKYPAVPSQRLAFLTTIFPDSDRNEPLKTTVPGNGDPQTSETILR